MTPFLLSFGEVKRYNVVGREAQQRAELAIADVGYGCAPFALLIQTLLTASQACSERMSVMGSCGVKSVACVPSFVAQDGRESV